MTLRSDAKFEGKMSLGIKNDIENVANFMGSLKSLKI